MPAPFILGPGGSSSAGVGVTRRILRRDIADRLGEWSSFVTVGTPSAATTGDANRQILADAIGYDDKRTDRFDRFYAYVVDGAVAPGETRQVIDGTYFGGISSLLMDRPFPSPITSGTEVELLSPLPAGRHLTVKGIHACINEAIRDLIVDVRLVLTGNGTRSYSLAAYPWLTLGDRIDGVWDRVNLPASEPSVRSPYPYRVVTNGADLTLITPYAYTSGTTFELRVFRQADTLINVGGTWTTSTTGLTSDTDAVAVPLHWVRAFALMRALRALITLTRRDRTLDRQEKLDALADYQQRLRTQAIAARRIIVHEFPRRTPEPLSGLVGGVFEETPIASGRWP